MKRVLAPVLALSAAAAVVAQLQVKPGGPSPSMPTKSKPALQGQQRIQYILKQLDLNPEQKKHADGLLETYFGASEPKSLDVDQIRQLAKQMEEAQKANNTAEYSRLQEQLKSLGQGTTDEPELVGNLKKVLNDEQKAELDATIERLKSNPSGGLRAIDVVRTARKLKLSDKQAADLEAASATLRAKVNDTGAPREPAALETHRAGLLEEFVSNVRATLTPEQSAKFDAKIANLRIEAPSPTPATPSAPPTTPATPPKGNVP